VIRLDQLSSNAVRFLYITVKWGLLLARLEHDSGEHYGTESIHAVVGNDIGLAA
jgi:hypothetical protein